MEVKLVVVSGKASKSEVTLTLPATIGRSRDASLTIAHMSVSRHHCQLEERDGQVVVRDNGSLNGTLVDGQRITEHVLRPGDCIAIGPLTFQAFYQPVAQSLPSTGDAEEGLEQWLSQMDVADDQQPSADVAPHLSDPADAVGPPDAPSPLEMADAGQVPARPGNVVAPQDVAGGAPPPLEPPAVPAPHETMFDFGASEAAWSEPTDAISPSDEEQLFDFAATSEPPLAADPAARAAQHVPASPVAGSEASPQAEEAPHDESPDEQPPDEEDPDVDPSLQDFFRRLP